MKAKRFRNQVEKRRIRRGTPRTELARRVGCSASQIRRIEIGEAKPSVFLAIQIAEELEVLVTDLWQVEDGPETGV